MKKLVFAAMAACAMAGCCLFECDDGTAKAVSPDGRNVIRLWTDPLAYEVVRDGVTVVAKTEIGLKVDGQCLNRGSGEMSIRSRTVSGTVDMPVYKKAKIDLAGNETFASFGDWGVRLAARNDGVAYRFETMKPRKVKVNCEKAAVTIPCRKAKCSLNYGFRYGCEETIPLSCEAGAIETGKDKQKYVYLPFVYSVGGKSVAVTESDVCDYPIWNLKRCTACADPACPCVKLVSEFAGYPKSTYRAGGWNSGKEIPSGGRWVMVKEHADCLVESTAGVRTFPWRTFVLADRPADLASADIVMALARGQSNHDFSWVKPGKVAWDWWNAWDNKGEKDGCNTATYKRFIDFAAKTGVEYVILDEGWSETLNIWKFHANVDVPEIIRYGNEKGVGIILWMAWAQVVGDEAKVASHFAKLGAKGFKVDFMDRGDAAAERFLWKFAEECAKNRMVVDYHGAHRPTGMSRAYPNVLNYEGVHGLECAKWFKNQYDFMDNDVKAFFLRLTAGPMDYTPGAMDNYPLGKYAGNNVNPGSAGTRCRQMAMMAMYEAPLQMLCDSPAKYEREAECFKFMAATPVVWADTVGLGGCPDSFAAVARKAKDGSWYAAAMTNKDARDYELDTSFLGGGEWKAEIFRDAPDADVKATAYVHETGKAVKSGDRLAFHMAPGGGFVVRFTK